LVFLELAKKYDKIYYKKNWWEIDFYVESEKLNIQVCYELNAENFTRETKVLKKWEKNMLIYFDKEKDLKLQDYIDFVSFNEIKI
jgi:hypothetical protein